MEIHTQKNNNTATFTLTNARGCDSTVTLDLTINHSSIGTDVQTACDSFTWIDGITYTENNNTATYTLTNTAGCDSVVTLNLTINHSSVGTDVQTACDSFTWIDGITYTENNNTATYTLTNAAGCDSVVTLNLTINHSSVGTDVQTACDSFTWIDGITYTENNNSATYTLTNAAGCDSVVTLNLTINHSSVGTDVQTSCDSFTWIDGITYTENNNSATYTLTNAAGCDSVVTLNLTINHSSVGTDVQTACDSFIWIDGNTYTESNNTATYTLTNAGGCDSVITLNLTINNIDVSVQVSDTTLTANQEDANYQWLDCDNDYSIIEGATNQTFKPTTTGNYAVEITIEDCIDTSECVNVIVVGINNTENANSIRIYPNPSNGIFKVAANEIIEILKITSVSGQILELSKPNRKEIDVNISNQAKGIYLIEIQTTTGLYRNRVITK
jgi:hypothetical protein